MRLDRSTIGTALLVATVGLGLSACSQAQLYTGLTEREANEMASIVQGAGFSTSKLSPDNGKTWSLTAPPSQFPQEVALLQARGYPREHFESLGDVFKKQGFVSSPTEEHARLTYAISQELARTLTEIDGVIDARVHVAIPEDDPLQETPKPASASVLIRYDPAVDLASQIPAIKGLVVNGVQGVPPERVTVVLSPARETAPPPPTAPVISAGIPAAGAAACLGAALGVGIWRRRRWRPRQVLAP